MNEQEQSGFDINETMNNTNECLEFSCTDNEQQPLATDNRHTKMEHDTSPKPDQQLPGTTTVPETNPAVSGESNHPLRRTEVGLEPSESETYNSLMKQLFAKLDTQSVKLDKLDTQTTELKTQNSNLKTDLTTKLDIQSVKLDKLDTQTTELKSELKSGLNKLEQEITKVNERIDQVINNHNNDIDTINQNMTKITQDLTV